jgi:outer membrane protein TolC
MSHLPHRVWLRPARLLCVLALFGLAGTAMAQAPAPQAKPLTLADCLRIADAKQPALTAPRASLAFAELQMRAAENLPAATGLFVRDLAVRKEQARLGVTATRASLMRAEQDTRYAVTRLYFAVLYARAQRKVLEEAEGEMRFFRDRVVDGVKKGDKKDWTESTVDLCNLYLQALEGRRAEAVRGLRLATAALKEAMGIDADEPVVAADEALFEPKVMVSRREVIDLARSRRSELVQAGIAVEVVRLEGDAQAKTCLPGSVRTFAAGADLHAEPVPAGRHDTEYRPGAVGLEMPTFLTGFRTVRVESARELDVRAGAVADKARGLVTLEAEAAFLRWEEAQRKLGVRRGSAETANRLFKSLGREFRDGKLVLIEYLLFHSVVITQARLAYHEAQFDNLVGLADLERVTAGGLFFDLAKCGAAPR